MKTPREVILERHQSAEAKLKAIRVEDLAACARSPVEASGERQATLSLSAIAGQLWQEMFSPWRRVWAGVAVTWVVILGLGLATGDMPRAASTGPRSANPEVLAVLQQQEQLLSQLLGREAPQRGSPSRTPGPRSAADIFPAA